MVEVNNGPIFLPMILSTIKTYNAKSFSNPSIDVESQQPIFPCKAKTKPSALHFQLYIILNRSTHIYIFELFDIQMHS